MDSIPLDKPAMNGYISELNNFVQDLSPNTITPSMPNADQLLQAVNPFTSKTSIKTKAECGVCRWSTWLVRGILGNPLSKDILIALGRGLCPLFIGEAGLVEASCKGIIN